jgi:hypothetical protein
MDTPRYGESPLLCMLRCSVRGIFEESRLLSA